MDARFRALIDRLAPKSQASHADGTAASFTYEPASRLTQADGTAVASRAATSSTTSTCG